MSSDKPSYLFESLTSLTSLTSRSPRGALWGFLSVARAAPSDETMVAVRIQNEPAKKAARGAMPILSAGPLAVAGASLWAGPDSSGLKVR